ncbi:hypothetical protein K6U06_11445 [Acidiferrimicrobium sp. IK]|uniref:Chromate resistance protein ChrB n=1 Tax=Acidiferrimicrobium sp. IK TaxID=2871700 RepID=UPI0021CB924D|nr:Chromate resistance protein ChrB [Acidiferrimicrobium sp. IK]MCU4184977.1 hypothetical protein [Acidiferrimicrobium sp. IK]
MGWRILTYRLSGEQSRHRVAVWRELRRVGAVALQSATWAVPTGDGFDEGLERATALVKRSGGQALCFEVAASDETLAAVESLYTAEREAEWVEFCSECDKSEAELLGEIDKEKFTLAELDEEEQNVDRLRRWYRELRTKDIFAAPSAGRGERRLKEVSELLEDFAERVYEARGRP